MPDHRVDEAAVAQARRLIDDGAVHADTGWSDAGPSADDGNAQIEEHGLGRLRGLAPRRRP